MKKDKLIITLICIFVLQLSSCYKANTVYHDDQNEQELSENVHDNMQGFWHLTGYEEQRNELIKRTGIAVDIDGIEIDLYSLFVMNKENAVIDFVDNGTFKYTIDGEVKEVDISFKSEDGYDLMIWNEDGKMAQFEKSSLDIFNLYKGFSTKVSADLEDKTLSLEVNLSDEELSSYISDIYWEELYYLYTDGTTEEMYPNNMVFYSLDKKGLDETTDGTSYITWEVTDRELYITYEDGNVYYFPVDYSKDISQGFQYLYLYDLREEYEGCAWIFYSEIGK